MDNKEIAADFIKNFRELVAESSHERIKKFNYNLGKHSHLLVYPFKYERHEKVQLLVGFANTFEIHPFGNENVSADAMSQLKSGHEFLTTHEDFNLSETLAISTSDILPVPLEKIQWAQLIQAPKLEDDSFDILQTSFLEHFNLDEYSYQDGVEEPFNFGQYFNQDSNKPEQLELHVVWRDTDRDSKYGTIQTLVMWKGEFIGWVTCDGRWLANYSASTVNIDKWNELMDVIYKDSGYKRGRNRSGVFFIYDMTKDEVDDVALVPGVSTPNYSDSE